MDRSIIVYIESCFLVSKGTYNFVLDFNTGADFEAFSSVMNVKDTGSYLVEILGYQSNKRLRSDTYHSLSLDYLRQAKYLPSEDNTAFCARFDFSQCKKDDNNTLLKSHPKLYAHLGYSVTFSVPCGLFPELPVSEMCEKGLFLRVNSVGQGNWNEIMCGGDVSVVYDIGADMHASKVYIQELIGGRESEYKRSLPVLILSHWDIDHYICLRELTKECIQQMFSAFVCPGIIHGITAQKVYEKMEDALNGHCYALAPAEKTEDPVAQAMLLESKSSSFLLYKGQRRHNRNRSGLILIVKGVHRAACLSGDALLSQTEYVVNHSKISLENILVVPHHGGDCPVSERHYNLVRAKCDKAIISVGDNNMYNHPSPLMLEYLMGLFDSVEDMRNRDRINPIIEGL